MKRGRAFNQRGPNGKGRKEGRTAHGKVRPWWITGRIEKRGGPNGKKVQGQRSTKEAAVGFCLGPLGPKKKKKESTQNKSLKGRPLQGTKMIRGTLKEKNRNNWRP